MQQQKKDDKVVWRAVIQFHEQDFESVKEKMEQAHIINVIKGEEVILMKEKNDFG